MIAARLHTAFGFTFAALFAAPAVAGPPVEGEAELLAVVRDMQAESREALRRGRVVGTVKAGRVEAGSEATSRGSSVDVAWDGPKLRAERRDESREQLDPEPTRLRRIFLETPAEAPTLELRFGFSASKTDPKDPSKPAWETSSRLTRFPPGGRVHEGRPATFRVDGVPRPLKDWFGLEGQMPWEELLDPDQARTVQRYVVRRAGDEVFVERHQNNGAIFLAVFSLGKSGNIVSYEYVAGPVSEAGRKKHRDRRGRFEWERTDGGVWWVRSFRIESTEPGERSRFHEFTATAFDPAPEVPDGFFTEAGLPIPGGTELVEVGADDRRRFIQLDPAPPSPGVELPPLGEAAGDEQSDANEGHDDRRY